MGSDKLRQPWEKMNQFSQHKMSLPIPAVVRSWASRKEAVPGVVWSRVIIRSDKPDQIR